MATYIGIRFPERAEFLDEYQSYKVFLEHWDSLTTALRTHFTYE